MRQPSGLRQETIYVCAQRQCIVATAPRHCQPVHHSQQKYTPKRMHRLVISAVIKTYHRRTTRVNQQQLTENTWGPSFALRQFTTANDNAALEESRCIDFPVRALVVDALRFQKLNPSLHPFIVQITTLRLAHMPHTLLIYFVSRPGRTLTHGAAQRSTIAPPTVKPSRSNWGPHNTSVHT